MVFETYTTGLGYPICGGGRYDKMAGAFGREQPATGFALGMERVLLALERQGLNSTGAQRGIYVGWNDGKMAEAIAKVHELRLAGETAELALQAQAQPEAEREAALRGCTRCLYLG